MFNLSDWAALAEIIASAAVVISLLLVAYSIRRNTAEIELSNSNFLYQLDTQIGADVSLNATLATIIHKVKQKESLTGAEKIQYVALQERYLSVLEVAWTQHGSGSLSDIDWRDWDKYLSDMFTGGLPDEWWLEIRSGYKPEFAEHVDSKYAQK
jgi:hypothetical protein